jgi:hypothetical protein
MSTMKKVRSGIGLVSMALGAVGAVRELQSARGKRDSLALVNAILNIAAVVTGAALAIRAMSKDGDDE